MSQIRRVALAARVFSLAAILAMLPVSGTPTADGGLIVLLIAATGQVLSLSRRISETWIGILEGAVAAAAAVALAPGNDSVVPYLTVPVLIGGLAGRISGLLRVIATEAVVMTVGFLFLHELSRPVAARGIVWMVTGIGLGLLGASIHRLLAETATDTSYRNAADLIKQLQQVSGRLSDGLDLTGIADTLLAAASDCLPLRTSALFSRTPAGTITPLRCSAGSVPEEIGDHRAREYAWFDRAPIAQGRDLTVPLVRDGQTVAVLAATCEYPPSRQDLDDLVAALSPETLKLHAALLFDGVRSSATQEERQRLAREVHDGIAQDVASLGYLLDGVTPADPEQESQLGGLREEISRVVGELRYSVFDLRNSVTVGRGLGESLSEMARFVGSRTTMAVHLSLDESGPRLRPKIESELLRIAQEAINNARKHSAATNLWVTCRVRAPEAELIVRDDGSGLGPGRDDSHGLQIMKERAAAVGADLEIDSPAADGRGTRVTVRVDR